MAWSIVQSGSNTVTSGGNGTFTFGSNLTSGTKIICHLVVSFTDSVDPVSGISDGSGNNLTLIKSVPPPGGNSNTWVEIWAMDTPAGDIGTKPTLTATVVSNFGVSMVVQEVSGLLAGNTTAMVDGTPGVNNGTNSPATSGSYTTTATNEFLVGLYGDPGDNVTVTNASGYTAETHNENSSNFATAFVSYKNSTNGSESASWSLSGSASDGWETILVAFKLAGGSPVSISGVVASITVAGISGSAGVSSIPGTVSNISVAGISGSLKISISGITSGITVAGQLGSISESVSGTAANTTVVAVAGSIKESISGSVANITVVTQPGSVQELISGIASNITIAGISGSITTAISGASSQINISAVSGSVNLSLSGTTSLINISAISGSISESIIGSTSTITVVAIPGTISQPINIIGVTSNILVTAHPGQISIPGNIVITGSLNSRGWTGMFLKNTSGKLISTNWSGNILKV